MNKNSLCRIEEEISLLSAEEQLVLVEKLIHRMRTAQSVPVRSGAASWKKFYGLGKGIWQGEDAQEYVTRLREDRR